MIVKRLPLLAHDTKATHMGLEEELQFVNSYLFFEQIRFGENLVFSVDGKDERHRTIIPASLQLLAENAIKHNVCTPKSPLIIRITVTEMGLWLPTIYNSGIMWSAVVLALRILKDNTLYTAKR